MTVQTIATDESDQARRDVVDAYGQLLDRLFVVRRTPSGSEPRPGRRSLTDEALYEAAAARWAVDAEVGPAAGRSAEAAADLRDIERLLDAARAADAAGVRIPAELEALAGRQRVLAQRAEAAAEEARAEAEGVAAREQLEADCALVHAEARPVLAGLLARYAEEAAGAAVTAAAHEAKLARLAAAREAYEDAVQGLRERYRSMGVGEADYRFSGEPWPSSAGVPLRAGGVPWPVLPGVAAPPLVADVRAVSAAVGPLVERERAAGSNPNHGR
jgi:hypothetical protein